MEYAIEEALCDSYASWDESSDDSSTQSWIVSDTESVGGEDEANYALHKSNIDYGTAETTKIWVLPSSNQKGVHGLSGGEVKMWKMHGWESKHVPYDGNCLFAAIGESVGDTPADVRNKILGEIQENQSDYEELYEHYGGVHSVMTDLSKEGEWGRMEDLVVAHNVYDAVAVVYDKRWTRANLGIVANTNSGTRVILVAYNGDHFIPILPIMGRNQTFPKLGEYESAIEEDSGIQLESIANQTKITDTFTPQRQSRAEEGSSCAESETGSDVESEGSGQYEVYSAPGRDKKRKRGGDTEVRLAECVYDNATYSSHRVIAREANTRDRGERQQTMRKPTARWR